MFAFFPKTQESTAFFPDPITETITLYIFWRDSVTGNQTLHRAELDGVFWNADSITVLKSTGQQVPTGIDIFIPHSKFVTGKQYVTPKEWYAFPHSGLDNYWTLDLNRAIHTRLVRGTHGGVFGGLMPQQQFVQRFNQMFQEVDNVEFVHNAFQPRDVNPQIWAGTKSFVRVRV